MIQTSSSNSECPQMAKRKENSKEIELQLSKSLQKENMKTKPPKLKILISLFAYIPSEQNIDTPLS